MLERDFEPFADMLDEVASVLPNAPRPTAAQKAMFFRAVAHFTIAQVRKALDAHIKDPKHGRFMPVPADVVGQIEGDAAADGRPGPEEAWALLPKTENESVVWTAEMAKAFETCRALLLTDQVAARMAFKETYARLVAEARALGLQPAWSASLGHDPERRTIALDLAVRSGRISPQLAHEQHPALPAPASAEPVSEARRGRIDSAIRETILKQRPNRAEWARVLQKREQSGERLSEALRMFWRNVLHDSPHAGPMPSDFRPVPSECLPPGMRGEV